MSKDIRTISISDFQHFIDVKTLASQYDGSNAIVLCAVFSFNPPSAVYRVTTFNTEVTTFGEDYESEWTFKTLEDAVSKYNDLL